jgi:S1-C subfamily serine protease
MTGEKFMQLQDQPFEKNEEAEKAGKLKTSFLLMVFVVCVLLSAFLGSLFGLLSAGAVSVFSPTITQKLQQHFPGLVKMGVSSQISKQQVIVEDSAIIDVVKKSNPAVVSILISKNVSSSSLGGFDPFGAARPQIQGPEGSNGVQQQIGEGSGFLISSDGLILTNRHVVDDRQATYTAILNDGLQYDAKVVAVDPARDVAVMKIEGTNFPVLSLGDSDSLQAGQTIVAIGNSLGQFTNSVSRGVVSGLKRNLDAGNDFGASERLTDIIQTDAAINPGNSGGPLINIDGNVVGINVAMAQGAQNIGFALPINQAKRIIEQVKNGTKISIPYLGIRYIVIDAVIQKQIKLPFNYGILVARGVNLADLAVIPGSPADLAGISENDIILEVDGEKLSKDNQLEDVLAKHKVGDTINMKIWHKGQIKDVSATLQELKQ